MSEINPYAAPAGDEPLAGIPPQPSPWRDGPLLVMHRDDRLPDRCIKCNQPAGGKCLPQTLYWHHAPEYLILPLAFFCGPLAIILLAWIFVRGNKIRFAVGICPAHRARRRRAVRTAWAVGLAGLALFIAGLLQGDPNVAAGIILAGGLLWLLGTVYGAIITAVVRARPISKQFIVVKRAGWEYLAQFPECHLESLTRLM